MDREKQKKTQNSQERENGIHATTWMIGYQGMDENWRIGQQWVYLGILDCMPRYVEDKEIGRNEHT